MEAPFLQCLTHVDRLYWKGPPITSAPPRRTQLLWTQMLLLTLSDPILASY